MSLTVPVTSTSSGANSLIAGIGGDEDTPETSESSQKSTKKLTLTVNNYDNDEEDSEASTSAQATMTGLAGSLLIGGPVAFATMTTTTSSSLSTTAPAPLTALTSLGSAQMAPQQQQQPQSTDNNLEYSHLSIKYIDDNSVSAPLSPEYDLHVQQLQQHQQQQKNLLSQRDKTSLYVDELKPYEPSDTDADSNLASTSVAISKC